MQQRRHARYLRERGAHDVMTVKANHPTLLRRLRTLPWAQIGVAARERARGHGSAETRTIGVISCISPPTLAGSPSRTPLKPSNLSADAGR
jgi:hypothetical protein